MPGDAHRWCLPYEAEGPSYYFKCSSSWKPATCAPKRALAVCWTCVPRATEAPGCNALLSDIAMGEIGLLLCHVTQKVTICFVNLCTSPNLSQDLQRSQFFIEWCRANFLHNSRDTIHFLSLENCALGAMTPHPWHGQRVHPRLESLPTSESWLYPSRLYRKSFLSPKMTYAQVSWQWAIPLPSWEVPSWPLSPVCGLTPWLRTKSSKSSDILSGPKPNTSSVLSMHFCYKYNYWKAFVGIWHHGVGNQSSC